VALLDPAANADELALQCLRVASMGTEEGAIAAAERDRKCAPPVGIEVEINHAAHLGDAYDAAFDDLERATVA
jgi:hypothetical protein